MHNRGKHLPRTLSHQIDAAQRDDRAHESALAGTNNRPIFGHMNKVVTLGAVQLDPIARR
jgi:hypothetical protein